MVLIYGDDRIGAVTGGGAGQIASQTLMIRGGIEGIAQRLARDVNGTVVFHHGHLFDGIKDYAGRIVGMGMESTQWIFAVDVA